ncbi:TIGR03086 family metal-binding protein [Mariniluteicoccus endophyticus]
MTQRVEARPLLPRAAKLCGDVIARIPDGAWDDPSPCEGWSVRDVVNHVTAEHLWAPRLLAGETMEQVGDAYDGDVLGEAPVSAWQAAITESLASWLVVNDDDREIGMSYGPCTVGEYACQMLVDLTVHAWDIATGAGIDVELDPVCVQACRAYEGPRVEAGGVESIFAPPREPRSNDPADRLLAMVGRA